MSVFVASTINGRQVERFVADTWLWQNPSVRKSTKSLCPLSPAFTVANNSFKDFFFFLNKNLAPQMQYELKPPKESLEGPKSLIVVLGGALRMQRRGTHRELCNEV